MNFVDFIIIFLVLYAAATGFRKGFIVEVFMLLALLTGLYAGIHFSDWTASFISQNFNVSGKYLRIVAFIITFLAVSSMVYFAGKIIERMLKIIQLGLINSVLGLLFGVIKMVFILSIAIFLMETYDGTGGLLPKKVKKESFLYEPIKTTASAAMPSIKESSIWLKINIIDELFGDAGINKRNMPIAKQSSSDFALTIKGDLLHQKGENLQQ